MARRTAGLKAQNRNRCRIRDPMDSILPYIADNIPDGGIYYALLFAIAMAESIAMIGLAVPGSTLIVCAGFFTAHGQGHLGTVMAAAGLGALAGDSVSYMLGARLGYRFLRKPFFRKYLTMIRKAEMFFIDHGGKSLFFGRFAGPLRGLTPFIAGSAKLDPGKFFGYTLFSCLLWGLVYPGLGSLGAASWQQVQLWSGRLSLLVTTLLILLVANGWFWSRAAPRLSRHIASARDRLRIKWQAVLQKPWPQTCRRRYPRIWRFVAARFSLSHGAGLYLTMGLVCCGLFAGLFFTVMAQLPVLRQLDEQIWTMIIRHHQPVTGRLMLLCSGLADRPVLLSWGFLLIFWLLLKGRTFSAAILLAGTGGGHILTFALKRVFARPRPLPVYPGLPLESLSFPSGHAFFALLLSGLTVYLMLGTIRNWQSRVSLVASASFVALLVGISRLFLGAHWFSDVLAGWLLAALWLSFLITALEVRRRLAGETLWHRQWHPPNFDRRLEKLLWASAASLALLATVRHLLSLWKLV